MAHSIKIHISLYHKFILNFVDFYATITFVGKERYLMKKDHNTNKTEQKNKHTGFMRVIFSAVSLSFCTLLACSATWYINLYGNVGFDSVIYSLIAGTRGINKDVLVKYILQALLPAIAITLLLMFFLYAKTKKHLKLKFKSNKTVTIYPFQRTVSFILALCISFGLFIFAITKVELASELVLAVQTTKFYEEEYVDPNTVNIEFPEKKQNLIFILLESVETSFVAKEQGGGREESLIPELYELAVDENNVNFSNTEGFGGALALTGGTWTIGAMVSQTAGVPLHVPINVDRNEYGKDDFLPGITSLSDILHENGYNQAVMVGSDSEYAGRHQFYMQHGTDTFFDLYTAREKNIIPENYFVWWGMDDKYLFEYAKEEITDMASKDEPFAFTLLTVDTHAWGGWVCDDCENEFDIPYDNVYACSSKKVAEFVEWIKVQDFFENTTVILCGDHLTMDRDYIDKTIGEDYDRRVYNCFINSRKTPKKEKMREFSTLDMFPTILSSLGCEIEGDRLGLGVDLFSEKETFTESMGSVEFDKELSKRSVYYEKNFYSSKNKEKDKQ